MGAPRCRVALAEPHSLRTSGSVPRPVHDREALRPAVIAIRVFASAILPARLILCRACGSRALGRGGDLS
jgi:hypothetical protein